MAITRLVIDGFGQLELNQVAFRRDGRIEAQCALDPTDFATVPAENGMLLGVDKAAGTIKLLKEGVDLPVAINYTSEHMYDDKANTLKDFKLGIKDGFYPRLGYLAVGDIFTTNCMSYDTGEGETEATIAEAIAAGAVYGKVSTDGSILLVDEKPTGLALKVVKETTMPDGQYGLKFQVLSI